MTPERAEEARRRFVRDHIAAHRTRRVWPKIDRIRARISLWRGPWSWWRRSVDEYDRHTRRIGPIVVHTLECCGCTCGDVWAEPEGREPATKEIR